MVPMMSTFSPSSKMSQVILSPTAGTSSPASSRRTSRRKRKFSSPAFLKWPFSGWVTSFSRFEPKPIWMAS